MSKRLKVWMIVLLVFLMSINTWGISFTPYIFCTLSNLSEEVYYVDLLIPISEDDEAYTDFNESNGKIYQLSKESEIVKYDVDGFRSYTFHFLGSDSKMQIYDSSEVSGNEHVNFADSKDLLEKDKMQYEILEKKYKKIKLAGLDREGRILQVSEAKYIIPNHWIKTRWDINYDVTNNKLEVEFYNGLPWGILGLFLASRPVIVIAMLIYIVDRMRVYIYNKYYNGKAEIHIKYLKIVLLIIVELAIWILCLPEGVLILNLFMFGGLFVENRLLSKRGKEFKRIKYVLLTFNGLVGYMAAWILYLIMYFLL